MSGEQWRPIAGYEGSYEVSDQGRVRGLDRVDSAGRRRRSLLLRPARGTKAYLSVSLQRDGDKSTRLVHRLVVETFLTPDPERLYANHKNGVKTDNRLANLEWSTRSENMKHAYALGLKLPRRTPVIGRQVSGGVDQRFESITAAARATGVAGPNIHDVLAGRRPTAAGYEWRRA